MSYHNDHMAWQQRVSHEMGAYRNFFDRTIMNNPGQLPPQLEGSLDM
jgi:hypothetical protein